MDKDKIAPEFLGSALIFVNAIEGFNYVEIYSKITRYQDQPFRYIFHIFHVTFESVKNTIILDFYKKIIWGRESMFHYSYFLIDEGDVISLVTFEWFKSKCNQAELVTLNSFEKFSLKWSSKFEIYEKFLDYNGCELVMALPYPHADEYGLDNSLGNRHHWGYSELKNNNTDFSIHGVSPKVFNIASKKFNFKDEYSSVGINYASLLKESLHRYKLYLSKNGSKPIVYFNILGAHNSIQHIFRRSVAFSEIKFIFLVTPAKAYGKYEKLLLPFDFETWIYLCVTFSLILSTIFIINRLSKNIQYAVYGRGVKNPLLNVFSIFFGIAQTKLPAEYFSRFILLLFVFFCLIFRTCYQGLLFKFITSEPRRPPPNSIQDLIDQNYSIYLPYFDSIKECFIDELEKW